MSLSGADGKHASIGSWLWNSWTPDPAGTGGILSSDYVTVDWTKVDYLNALGLFPWYTQPTAHRLVRICCGLHTHLSACFNQQKIYGSHCIHHETC